MPEFWFYHLERMSAETIVPQLLRRGLERRLRLSVQTTSPKLVQMWSNVLWSAEETGFLAHGTEAEPGAEKQPILLTSGPGNANGSQYRFYVDGCAPEFQPPGADLGLVRASILFDGHDEVAVAAARALWKAVREARLVARYQRQDAAGAWSEAGNPPE